MIPCLGGPCGGLGLLVELPVPLEVQRDGGGTYILEERGKPDDADLVYVWIET